MTRLVIRPGEQGRDPNVNRFYAERTSAGASVLLLEDTWVSGASAQSAAAALKRAGARHVAVVVLGRYIDPADRLGACWPPGSPGPLRRGQMLAVHTQYLSRSNWVVGPLRVRSALS